MTAVEWLVEQLNSKYNNNDFIITHINEIEQALEMEKQQQDDFAIGFAEWCLADFYISLQTGIDAKADTIEQLLEIYKKERGL